MTARPRLIASYFTLAGDVRPLEGSIVSPHDFRVRAEAAGRAGFDGFGFAQEDLDAILTKHDHPEICAILDDNGLEIREIEVLLDWFTDGDRRIAADEMRRKILASAEALGAIHIKAGGDLYGGHWSVDRMAEDFAVLCDDAREHGTKVCIELFPASNLWSLEDGMAVVAGSGRANGGLLLDIWHMTRGRIDFAAIARLPGQAILHIELDDGSADQVGDLLAETIDRRLPCGQGAFDLPGFLASVAATGYDGAFGVELLSPHQRGLDVDAAARLAHDTTRAVLDRDWAPRRR